MYQINTLLWPIKNNSDTIELTVHTSCYCIWTYSVLFGSLSHLLNIYLLQHITDLTTMARSTFQGQQILNLISFGNNDFRTYNHQLYSLTLCCGSTKGSFINDVTQIRAFSDTPFPSVTLKWLFYLDFYTWCHKCTNPPPPTCVTSFMNDH